MSCGVGCRRGSDPSLLWLWRRLAATAPIRPLAWEPPYAVGVALKRLLDQNLMHSIAVIGGGNEMESLKKQAKELGVEKTFLLLDSQKNPWPYVKAADYFVLPSKSESYPLTIGEVMGLHKPIISTNVGGIPEMIEDGKDGILVNFDENEIYEAMKKFLTDPDLVMKITNGTKNADEKFDENKIYQQVTQVFEQQFRLKNA